MVPSATTASIGETLIDSAGHDAVDPVAEPWLDTEASRRAARASSARKASTRRRMVDPATCDRDYSAAELEFLEAIQDYKQRSGRMFPTWSEALEVLVSLGYAKKPQPETCN